MEEGPASSKYSSTYFSQWQQLIMSYKKKQMIRKFTGFRNNNFIEFCMQKISSCMQLLCSSSSTPYNLNCTEYLAPTTKLSNLVADHHIRLHVYLLPSACSMCLHLQKLWVVVNDIEQNTVNVRPQLWIHFLLFLQSCSHLKNNKNVSR